MGLFETAAHRMAVADAEYVRRVNNPTGDIEATTTAGFLAETGAHTAAGIYLRAYRSARRAHAIELADLAIDPRVCRGCGYADGEYAVVAPCVPGAHALAVL